jgi:hypothetical protein
MIQTDRTFVPALLLVPLLGWGGYAAADTPDAHALYEQNCLKCHGPEVYTRADRKIDSLPALAAQVRRCETNLELRWFDEDIDGVTDYLNRTFYKFKP